MSWLNYSLTKTTRSGNPNFTAEAREERRAKLEADRILKQQKRADRQRFFKAGISAPTSPVSLSKSTSPLKTIVEDDQKSLPDIFHIDDELFNLEFANMANFDSLTAENGADAIKNLGQIKVNWDAEDPSYFFQKLETELQIFEVNKQYTKRQALIRLLPDNVGKEFKHLINLQETDAGNVPYKTLKDALIKAYGPRPGDAFQRALGRVMVGKPSVLLKLLISDICKHSLANCCCNNTVWGLFQLKIPMYLKTGLSNEVFNAANMHGIMDRADNLWASNQTTTQISTVTVSAPSTEATAASTEVKPTAEVSAIRGRGNPRQRGNRGRGFNNRGRGGQSRGGQNQNAPDPRGKRHESNPPFNSCTAHWLYSDAAFKCQSPTTCPMKDRVTPKA